MAKHTGKDGVVQYSSSAIPVSAFTVEEDGNIAAYVDSTTNGWEDNEVGAKRWSGTLTLTEPPSFKFGDTASVSLYTGAETLSGSIRIGKISRNVALEGGEILSYTVEFRGRGALTIATGSA